jgi:hypothetical protein
MNMNFGSVILQITPAVVMPSVDTTSWNNQTKEWQFCAFKLYCASRMSEEMEPETVFVEEARESVFPWRFLPSCWNLNWHLAPILFLSEDKRLVDTWSLVWYALGLISLVAFFLLIGCLECRCCRRETRTPPNVTTASPFESTPEVMPRVQETTLQPHDPFELRSYDTLHYGLYRV